MKKMITCYVTALVFLAASALSAEQKSVPNVLTFQSVLFDDGGNLIADGPVNIMFRITDSSDSILYEERQTIEAVRGQVSAIVGGGLDANGAPTGGIPLSALDPASSRYLTVEVDGMPATSALEIASVPYAIYAGQALGVAKSAIDSAAIADGGIAYEDLGTDLISKLASNLTGGRGAVGDMLVKSDLETMYRDPSSASSIGVKPGFVYSSANDLQGVLTDLDRAVTRREERIVAHAAATSGIHGVTGNIVGTTDIQTLSNKTYGGSLSGTAGNHGGTWQGKNPSDFTSAGHDHDSDYVNVTGDAMSGVLDMGENRITKLAAPSGDSDAARKQDVDSVKAQLDASAPLPNQLYVNAWGSISDCHTSLPTYFGGNITSVQYPTMGGNEASGCWITFTTPMPSTAYIVVLNSVGSCAALDKSTTSFRIPTTTTSCGSFDFIAIGK